MPVKISFEAYRRLVLKELRDVKVYPNFVQTLRAFALVDGIDRLAADLIPLLRACYNLDKSVEFTAVRIDDLTKRALMAGSLYMAELEKEKQ